jgi:hypothetical protein
MVDQHDALAALGRDEGAHHAGSACADYRYIVLICHAVPPLLSAKGVIVNVMGVAAKVGGHVVPTLWLHLRT